MNNNNIVELWNKYRYSKDISYFFQYVDNKIFTMSCINSRIRYLIHILCHLLDLYSFSYTDESKNYNKISTFKCDHCNHTVKDKLGKQKLLNGSYYCINCKRSTKNVIVKTKTESNIIIISNDENLICEEVIKKLKSLNEKIVGLKELEKIIL